MASIAPKKHSYSVSESQRSQLDCNDIQKNLIHKNILVAKSLVEISPSTTAKSTTSDKKVTKFKSTSNMENDNDNKRRRLEKTWLEEDLHYVDKKTKECTTYKPSVDNTSDSGVDQIKEIPPPVTPITTQLSCKQYNRVYFDLETGGFATGTDILQISAISGTHEFNQYITPVGYISPGASEVTGLTCDEGVLMLHRNPVASISIMEALNLFIAWLGDLGKCLLIAHNVKFDARHICYHVEACKLIAQFTKVVCGFTDTLPILKRAYPGQSSYKQPFLVSNILKESYEAHNAMADVKALRKLIKACGTTDEEMETEAFSSSSVFEKQNNIASLQGLINSKALSKEMANKTAMSGIQLHHLNLSIKQGGFEGLHSLLTEIIDGKPRVTKNMKIITNIFEFLSEI